MMATFALAFMLAMGSASISGTVRDSTGAAVPDATVTARVAGASGETVSVRTGLDGRFSMEVPDGEVVIVVRAGGFAEQTRRLTQSSTSLDIVLEPATLLETVVVTATRTEQRMGDLPASVTVVTSDDVKTSPALIADDVLRHVPTFSLFRRTSALAAQPTTQGVSLRGIGPSGQSRTLVLLDGAPFNDPFGGWVYWTRVPLASVDRIEVNEGSTSSLYGNYAMGGVINIITNRPAPRTLEVKPQYGNHDSPKADFFASDRWNRVGVAVEGSFLNTDGFPLVEKIERGPIDNNANVKYRNVSGKADFAATDRLSGSFRVGYFTEDRVNGKVGELNDTKWTTVNGGLRVLLPGNSELEGRVFGDVVKAHFNTLAVTNAATTRNVVRLSLDQHVPTNAVGGMVQWSKTIASSHVFSAGTDFRWVDGDSQEDAFVAAVPTVISGVTQAAALSVQRVSGGTQQILGGYLQDVFTPVPHLVLNVSARVDHWRNYDGHNLETTAATGLPTANNRPSIPERIDTVVSPHLGALYHVSERLTVWGAANSGFRAPTLTELYRQFSVGTITTRPNDQLGPERLVGGEIGVNVAPLRNLTARMTWFDNRVRNPVLNVTLNATTAQKQNLGKTKIQGVQADVEYRAGSMRFSGGYMYNQATVTDGGVVNAVLVGKFVPQVPAHRGSFQVAYANPKYLNVAVGLLMTGLQYNDDLNVNFIPPATLTDAEYTSFTGPGLPGYTTVDLTASRDLGRNLQIFFGVQNLLDQVYFVQTNPSTIGTPRLVNGGVRIRFSGR